ncbi:MAG: hypothetical protein HIU91_15385 [Acidobacteria bacterium]|nr:hypothetical protein [Acidobacteriota bacterium]
MDENAGYVRDEDVVLRLASVEKEFDNGYDRLLACDCTDRSGAIASIPDERVTAGRAGFAAFRLTFGALLKRVNPNQHVMEFIHRSALAVRPITILVQFRSAKFNWPKEMQCPIMKILYS